MADATTSAPAMRTRRPCRSEMELRTEFQNRGCSTDVGVSHFVVGENDWL
jgi:hypothetical protein